MKRIGVGLIRVSTGAQADEDRASIPAQREIIRQIAARHDIEVSRTFELADISGAAVLISSEYQAFLKCLEDPRINCVITREFSRLMRPERFDDFAILQHFVDNGITLYFPTDVLDLSSRQARFMAGIRAGVSGLERGDIAERIASAKEVLRKKGYHPGGEHTLALGLGHTKEKGWYYDEAEIEKVKLLFRLFLGGCQTYEELSKLTGISRTSIPVILRNPVYAGWMVYSQRKDLSPAGYIPPDRKRKGYRRKINRPDDEVIRVQIPLAPIITEEQHVQIVKIVESKRRHWTASRATAIPRFTYRGFLFCGSCSGPMYTWAAAAKKDFYHCKANLPRYRNQPGATGCPNRNMSRHLLEPILDAEIVKHLTDPDFLTETFRTYYARLEQERLPSAEEMIAARYETLQKKRARVIEAFLDGNITRLQKNEALSAVDDEIDSLRLVEPIEPQPAPQSGQVAAVVRTFMRWPLLSMPAKREIMERVLPEIFVDRYLIKGVSLRLGYSRNNPPKTAAPAITPPIRPAAETTIFIPFRQEVVVSP